MTATDGECRYSRMSYTHTHTHTHTHTETKATERQIESERGKVETSVRTMTFCLLFSKPDTTDLFNRAGGDTHTHRHTHTHTQWDCQGFETYGIKWDPSPDKNNEKPYSVCVCG